MRNKPLRISFPVCERIERFTLNASGTAIILQIGLIKSVDPTIPSSNYEVLGALENGKLHKFTIPAKEWEIIKHQQVMFLETQDQIAPTGALLYDSAGNVLSRAHQTR